MEKLNLNDLLRKELQLINQLRITVSQPPANLDRNIEGNAPRAPFNANEKLTSILCNIRKNKERTIFDSLRHQRPTKKSKVQSKLENTKKNKTRNNPKDKNISTILSLSDSDPDDPPAVDNPNNVSDLEDDINPKPAKSKPKKKSVKRKHIELHSSSDSDLDTENFNEADCDLFKSIFASQKSVTAKNADISQSSNSAEKNESQSVPLFSEFVAARNTSSDDLFGDDSNELEFSFSKNISEGSNHSKKSNAIYKTEIISKKSNSTTKPEDTPGPSGVKKFIQIENNHSNHKVTNALVNNAENSNDQFKKPEINSKPSTLDSGRSSEKSNKAKISPVTWGKLRKFAFTSKSADESAQMTTEVVKTQLNVSSEILSNDSLNVEPSEKDTQSTQGTQSKNPFVFSAYNDDDLDVLDDI